VVAPTNSSLQFQRIQEAWEVLSDPDRRRQFDLSRDVRCSPLSQQQLSSVPVFDELPLGDMAVEAGDAEEEGGEGEFYYTLPCRCGQSFALSSVDVAALFGSSRVCDAAAPGQALHALSVLVPCGGCSYHIRVHGMSSVAPAPE
jgi:curved DNA-binding protein CbpA